MRKPRAILFDDEPIILFMLRELFELKGYEVIAHKEPVLCPVYDDQAQCGNEKPCGDIMIVDQQMPRMTGVELLQAQNARGCKLTNRNKAVFSGALDTGLAEVIRRMGCAMFEKPCDLDRLESWIRDCEQRLDLTRLVGIKRKEVRTSCRADIMLRISGSIDTYRAMIVNKSGSGLCVMMDRPVAVDKLVQLRSELPLSAKELTVRWTRPKSESEHLIGLSC